ncbi:MAG TPA: UBP-type zinc finger domain-containing protein [Anaerolineales bacterium]
MPRRVDPEQEEPYRTLREMWTGTTELRECRHMKQIQPATPSSLDACAECVALGDTWPHLRICLTCGYVGCCDMAKNQHMLKHYKSTGHPLIQSFELGEDWIWCYADEAVLAPPKSLRGGLRR